MCQYFGRRLKKLYCSSSEFLDTHIGVSILVHLAQEHCVLVFVAAELIAATSVASSTVFDSKAADLIFRGGRHSLVYHLIQTSLQCQRRDLGPILDVMRALIRNLMSDVATFI